MSASALAVEAGSYRVAPTRSTVEIRVRHFGRPIHGSFTVDHGEVTVVPGRTRVSAEVQAGSFLTGNSRRDTDVVGPRFLDAASHPTLGFTGEVVGATLHGELTVRDVTAPVTFELETRPDGRIRATTQLDRRVFGIRAPRALIGRYVDVELTVTLAPSLSTDRR